MTETETIMMLIEANRLMSKVIDRLYPIALQAMTIDGMEKAGINSDIQEAAEIMKDY